MAWSPPALIAGIVWVSAPGDYATLNSNHTPDGTIYPNTTALFESIFGCAEGSIFKSSGLS